MEAPERKKNRWIVTYTKQIKQKRKVYQDGFLDHFIITNKVVLFDTFEKLLECRVLKDEDIVSSGQTLTFNSYLVDVGDPEGDHAPVPGRDKRMPERVPGLSFRKKFRSPSISKENLAERNNVRRNDLSTSHKTIREFRKTELQKHEAPKNSKHKVELGPAEWQVLYTTQVAKKAKTYHDGFLWVANCGSLQRQIMLYDASRKSLTSRFLKKDEIVASGGSIAMDGHLVDIGEAVEDTSPSVNTPDEHRDVYADGKFKMMPGQWNCSESTSIAVEGSGAQKLEEAVMGANKTKQTTTEWLVMYTSQMTQKAKKYHDGFLKLETRGSLGRQVKLYDASWNVVESRHLKKDERIRSGESVAFGAHLVDVGELRGDDQLPQDSNAPINDTKFGRKPDREQNTCLRYNNDKAKENSDVDGYLPRADSNLSSLTKSERTKFVETAATKLPLRDACQILSILKKPQQKGSINQDQKDLVRPIQVLEDSPDGDSKLQRIQGAQQLNSKTSYFDCREEATSSYSQLPAELPAETEARHSSQKNNQDKQEKITKPCGEDSPSSPKTGLTRHSCESNAREQLNIDSEELPSFDLGF